MPLTFDPNTLERLKPLTGIAVEEARVSCGKTSFSEAILFTHRGISGPAILQISSYWREGAEIEIAMLPSVNVFEALRAAKARNGRQAVQTALAEHLPKKLAQVLAQQSKCCRFLQRSQLTTTKRASAAPQCVPAHRNTQDTVHGTLDRHSVAKLSVAKLSVRLCAALAHSDCLGSRQLHGRATVHELGLEIAHEVVHRVSNHLGLGFAKA